MSVPYGMLPAMHPTPWTLTGLDQALRASWAADTCSPDDIEREAWHPDNPAWGHCDITALVVHDLFGGDLLVAEVHHSGERAGYHWWNRLPSGLELDLTREQFRAGQTVGDPCPVHRPPGPLPRRHSEYALLRARVATHLGPLPEAAAMAR
jgi:hypothetical protein